MRNLLCLVLLLALSLGAARAEDRTKDHGGHDHEHHVAVAQAQHDHSHEEAAGHAHDHDHGHDHDHAHEHEAAAAEGHDNDQSSSGAHVCDGDCVECVMQEDHHDEMSASLNILGSVGTSDAETEQLAELQGGGHDPNEESFNLQQIELGLDGRINEWLRGSAHILYVDEEIEAEEAYLTLGGSEGNAELRAGYLLAPFGLVNQLHPHSWQWVDQPIIATRLLGSEGSRALGFRGDAWTAGGLRLSAALQQADDETMVSFRGAGHTHGDEGHGHEHDEDEEGEEHEDEEGEEHEDEEEHEHEHEHLEELYGGLTVGNRPLIETDGGQVLSLRLSQAWRSGCLSDMAAGLSWMGGPNGSGADSRTQLWGADFSLRWQPCPEEQWPFVLWESEYMQRSFAAAVVFNDEDPDEVIDLPALTLRDKGWYSQVLYGFKPGWAAGLRYEFASGTGESVDGIAIDPLRDERTRISPLLTYYPDANTRLRLQYNMDRAQFLGDGTSQSAGTVWLNVDMTLGNHGHHGDPGLGLHGHGGHEHDSHDHQGHDHSGHDHSGHDHSGHAH